MNKTENMDFIIKTESLVKPQDVTAISFLGDFNKLLPKKSQDKIMKKGSKLIEYMGFIVEPYAFFIAYEIKDKEKAQEYLPQDYELVETSIFEGGEKKNLLIVSAFTARTSAFIGTRLEFYLIAKNINTGITSWIIADYETNTNSHDPKNGFCGYSSDSVVFTTTPYGELIADFKSKNNRIFSSICNIKDGDWEILDQNLWVEGNLSIDYGGVLKDESSENFSLIFDPFLMKEAINIPLDNLNIGANTFFNDIIDPHNPVTCAIFPYSQHFVIKQDLKEGELTKEDQLEGFINRFVHSKNLKTMAGDDIKKPIIKGLIITWILNIAVIGFLVLKVTHII
ncbi:MAG: hypothetical protein JXR64_11910 [Spirochaetales bacterium]|nr:hypothetical protein [Spirochaetales bacterium]